MSPEYHDRFMWRFYAVNAVVYVVVGGAAGGDVRSWVFWCLGSVFVVFAWVHRRRLQHSIVERVSRELEGSPPTKGFSK